MMKDGPKNAGEVDIRESKMWKRPAGVVILEGKKPEREIHTSDRKGKGKIDSLEMENQYLWKRLRKLEKAEKNRQARSNGQVSGVSGTSGSPMMESVNGHPMHSASEVITSETVTIKAQGGDEHANTQSVDLGKSFDNPQNKAEAGSLDMSNPSNWIMVVYRSNVLETNSVEHPGLSKEDVEVVIKMFEAEEVERAEEALAKQQDREQEDFMPSFDIEFCTPEPLKKEDILEGGANVFVGAAKSSGTLHNKPLRRRLQPLRLQDHVLSKLNARRAFKDPKKWEEVKKSFIGIQGRHKEDDILEKVWMYVTSYMTGDKKWEPVFEYDYFKYKFVQNMLREELRGMAHVSNTIMDLYALRLMSKWKIKKLMRLHSPIYIMSTAFSKIVLDDFIVGGIATPFEDVKNHFLLKSEEGNFIFKHADRVFIPILSSTSVSVEDKVGTMHWWCICINFAQPRVDVLDSLSSGIDAQSERCVQRILDNVISARARIKNKEYDTLAFIRGGNNGISKATMQENINACGLHVMKWYEDWDGLYETDRFANESDVDFKKWMVADMIIDGGNKELYTIVPKIGYPISNL